jgi:CubicO group peptidase (beta-lactamase class C family)
MKLYDQGRIALTDLLVKYVPQADNNGKGEITIENLLLHNAGLPVGLNFALIYFIC